ncbi:PREDICTED: receptor-type tyrosine-protein phosphatase delta-like isoform X1 [Branchiostoma belcheri]|uniref:Receptor-type tyrosine-protein phosphatase delta-like isoform X1 n=1 Tax=Branchiostoma belcheri TaxID=7741 RepID=A0A6P4ZBY8_BRABE|nr:PREDICTED: receptor-type tyrosine-protein phosphatase delta-like isoform X1 [Branchiostoma belcheri]
MGSQWRSGVALALFPMVLFLHMGLSSAQFDSADFGLECTVCNEAHSGSAITCTWRNQPNQTYSALFKLSKKAQDRCPNETEWQSCNLTSENSCQIPFHDCADPFHDTYYVMVNSSSMLFQTINFIKPDIATSCGPPKQISEKMAETKLRSDQAAASSCLHPVLRERHRIKPDPPENLRVASVSSRGVTVEWDMPRCAELLFTSYICAIEYVSLRDNSTREKEVMIELQNPQYETLGDLVPHTRYLVHIQCRQVIGELWSEYSPYMEVQTNQSAPSSPPVVRTPAVSWRDYRLGLRNMTLRWESLDPEKWNSEILGGYLVNVTDPRTGETVIYNITASGVDLYTLTLGNLQMSDYLVKVVAYNNKGLSPPRVIQLQDISRRPDQPRNVVATVTSEGDVLLSWQPPAAIGGIKDYFVTWCEVERDRRCAGEGNVTSVPGTQLTVTLRDGWMPYSRYRFIVKAATTAGKGEPSSTVYLYTVEGVPSSPPQNVTVQADTSTSLLVSWKPPPLQDRRGVITTYRVYYYVTPTISGQQMAADAVFVSVNVTNDAQPVQFSLPGLTPFTDYTVRVSALTSRGEGVKTDPVSARTEQAAPSDAPSNVQLIKATVNTLVISWTPPSQPNGIIQGYTIHYGDSSQQVGNQTKVVLEGLEGDMRFPVRVQACTGALETPCGPLSPVENFFTKVGEPGVPMNLRVSFDEYTERLHVVWDPPVPRNARVITYLLTYGQENDDLVYRQETTQTEWLVDKSKVYCRRGWSYFFRVEARPKGRYDLFGESSGTVYFNCNDFPNAYLSIQHEPVSLTEATIAGVIAVLVLFGICLAVSGPKLHKRFKEMKGQRSQLPGAKNYYCEEGTYYSVPGDSFFTSDAHHMYNPYVISDSGVDKETVDDISQLKKLGRQWSHDSAIGLDSSEGSIVVDVPGKSAHYSTASSSSGCSDGSEESLLPHKDETGNGDATDAEKGDVVWEKRGRTASTNTTSSHGSSEHGSEVAEYSKVAAVGGKFRDLNINYVPKKVEKEEEKKEEGPKSRGRDEMVDLDPSKLISVHSPIDLSPDQIKHRLIDPDKIVYIAKEPGRAEAEV